MQTDGQLKTGRDVVIAALLGAEEYGFATAPLVVSGCIMMRVCHLDTCPVGVATQNPVLRERFTGKAEYVVNFFEYIAEEVRELLAELGFRTLDEAIGQVELARRRAGGRPLEGRRARPVADPARAGAARGRRRCATPPARTTVWTRRSTSPSWCRWRRPALEPGEPVRAQVAIRNVNRTVGTILGHEVTKKYGGEGLPDGTIDLTFTGSAGQSFGAFVPRGITLRLEGDANDYVGKGLSGGRIVVRPDRAATFDAERADHRRQRDRVRRDHRRDLHPRRRRRAVLRPQLRRHGRHRGRRRPRLRVHDRRPGRRPRPDRAQLRGRHVRRRRLRPRPRSPAGSTPSWSSSAPSPATRPPSSSSWCARTSRRPARRSPRSCSPTGRPR